jgi:shikimate dehydrogenase
VHGIRAALLEAGVTSVQRAVVLGGGATTRSALAALATLGERRPVLVVRSERSRTLAAAARLGVTPSVVRFSADVLEGCDLLVSTLPGAGGRRVRAARRRRPGPARRRLRAVADGSGGRPARGWSSAARRLLLHQATARSS